MSVAHRELAREESFSMGSALWFWSGDWADSPDPLRRRTGVFDAGQSEPKGHNH